VKLYELKNLVFRRNARFTLHIADFSLEQGERVAVVGPNGSGKTTLLRLLSFLEKPDSWTRFLHKEKSYSPGKVDRSGLGFLKQQPYLFSGSLRQNLAYPLKLRRLPPGDVSRRVEAMLALLELDHLADQRAQDLSGGEQKRLAMGRVLIAGQDTLLLDEPIANLDTRSRSVIEDVLRKTGETILLTTHDLHFAHRVADRVLNLRAGRISPSLPENILEGQMEKGNLVTGNGLSILLPSDAPLSTSNGSLTVMVDPRNLVISLKPPASRIDNQFYGHVSSIREQGNDVWLEVDCGDRLTAIISRASYEEIGLNLHRDVVVSFEAYMVEVL